MPEAWKELISACSKPVVNEPSTFGPVSRITALVVSMEAGAGVGAAANPGVDAATMGGCTAAAAAANGAASGADGAAAGAEAELVAAAGNEMAGAAAAAAEGVTNAAADGARTGVAEAAEAAGRIEGAGPAHKGHAWINFQVFLAQPSAGLLDLDICSAAVDRTLWRPTPVNAEHGTAPKGQP